MKTVISNKRCWLIGCIMLSLNLFGQSQNEYIYIEGSDLKYKGAPFFALSVNYLVSIARDDLGNLFIAPYADYSPSYIACTSKTDCYNSVKADILKIKQMGFNSIRLIGVQYGVSKNGDPSSAGYETFPLGTKSDGSPESPIVEYVASDFSDLKGYLADFLQVVDDVNNSFMPNKPLKVQLLAGGKKVDNILLEKYTSYLEDVSFTFRNNTTLFAYDFYNEPAFFLHYEYSKEAICLIVNKWNQAVKYNSPNHLTTLGLSTFGEVNRWDPGFMNLDFLSYHLYPYPTALSTIKIQEALNRVKSHIKWISETSKKPWILGEIGFKAEDQISPTLATHNGSEVEQKSFFEETLKMVRDCGGVGYSIWQYKDDFWGNHHNYWGLVDENGNEKLAASSGVFNNFDPLINSGTCDKPTNYYNFYDLSDTYFIEGMIKNQNFDPIENAVITVWEEPWSSATHTFSDQNGYFKIRSVDTVAIFLATGYGMSKYWLGYPSSNPPPITNKRKLNIILHEYLKDNVPTTDNLILNNEIVQQNLKISKEAEYTITANNYLIEGNGSTGSEVSFRAGQEIWLNKGFKAEKGSSFHASILNFTNVPSCDFGYDFFRKKEVIDIVDENKKLNVFPNPARDNISLEFDSERNNKIVQIEVFDLNGKIVIQGIANLNGKINISKLRNGMYFIRVIDGSEINTVKFIKQ